MSAVHVLPERKIDLTSKEIAERVIKVGEAQCGVELYPYQHAMAMAILIALLDKTGVRVTGAFSRQTGKTECIAVVVSGACSVLPALAKLFPDDPRVSDFVNGLWAGIYAPKDEQSKLAFSRVKDYAESDLAASLYMDPDIDIGLVSSSGDQVSWSNGSRVRARTASDQSKSEGETYHLLIMDEAQDISSLKIKKELLPMLASTNGCAVQIGTACGHRGHFYITIERNNELAKKDGIRRHFEFDYKEVIRQKQAKYDQEVERWRKFAVSSEKEQARLLEEDPLANKRPNNWHLNYAAFMASIIEEAGGLARAEQDETFQMNYMIIWVSSRSIAVMASAWESLKVPNIELNSRGYNKVTVGGLDVAKGVGANADETILSICDIDFDNPIIERGYNTEEADTYVIHYVKTLMGLYVFRGDFEESQYTGIMQACSMYFGLKWLTVDSTGMGDPVCSRLQALMKPTHVEGLSWNSIINKSNVYKNFLMNIRGSTFRYPAGPLTQKMPQFSDMNDQILGLRKTFKGSGSLLVCEAEEGEHDDYPDSIALCLYSADKYIEQRATSMTEVIVTESDFTRARTGSGQSTRKNLQQQIGAARSDRYREGRR